MMFTGQAVCRKGSYVGRFDRQQAIELPAQYVLAMAASVQIPAVCDNCGAVFPSGFALGPGAMATMLNNKSGPCPRCGAMGSVPDGTYRFAQEVEAVVAPWSNRERATLANELQGARQANERKVAEGALRKRPGLKGLAERYLKPKDANSFWAFIAVILMVLSMAGVGSKGEQKTKVIEKETVIKIEPPQADRKAEAKRKKKPPPPPRKSGRSSTNSKKRSSKRKRRNKM